VFNATFNNINNQCLIHIVSLHLLYFQSEYFITFLHRIFNKSNTTYFTSRTGIATITECLSSPPDFNGLVLFIVFNYML
jgi:hypothetical protein